MKYIDADRLKAEIERRIKENDNIRCDSNKAYCQGYGDAFVDLFQFLDALSEEDALPCWKKVHTYTEELHEGDMEKMLLDLSIGKGKRETKIALPDKVVDTISEEPVSEDLEEEIKRVVAKQPFFIRAKDQIAFARHFTVWGAEHAKKDETPVSEELEEAANEFANQDCVTFISRKKGFIAGAEWQKKQMV